jgi:hypothetical protein
MTTGWYDLALKPPEDTLALELAATVGCCCGGGGDCCCIVIFDSEAGLGATVATAAAVGGAVVLSDTGAAVFVGRLALAALLLCFFPILPMSCAGLVATLAKKKGKTLNQTPQEVEENKNNESHSRLATTPVLSDPARRAPRGRASRPRSSPATRPMLVGH